MWNMQTALSSPHLFFFLTLVCNPPRKILYYCLNQSTLALKRQ
jgi:hypothetical protein